MLISTRLPLPPPSMSMYDNSHQTNSTSLIPPRSIPKHFNVPFAIQHGYFRCVRYLLQLDCDPNERDRQLRTPLILCSYVENNRWSLSLTQNLLEKGAKIALEDHARRNAMHHACALQRVELVQLYLSCLDFNIEAKDCEGNTCLHYVAITGNCEIAELLVRSAEKVGIRLDRYVNREGCSAAVLALKYGHIECANQITHRDSDEFFVIPRPLSIYENLPTKSKTKPRINSHHSSPNKIENRPSTLSFGLFKIAFNDNDTRYSIRLANLCKQDKQSPQSQHSKTKQTTQKTIQIFNRTKSTVDNNTRYSSTQALVNESQTLHRPKPRQKSFDSNEILQNSDRMSPRIQLHTHQQRLSNSKDNNSSFIQKTQISNDHEESKGKITRPSISHSTLNQSETNKFPRPKTTVIPPSSQLSPSKIKTKKNDRIDSSTNIPQAIYPTRQGTGIIQHSTTKSTDLSYPIREAKGPTSRYNKPEELFGLRPEELFGLEEHQPKILDPRSTTKTDVNKRNQLQKQYRWQQDVDKIMELYNIHHSVNYRKSVAPPLSSTLGVIPTDTITDLIQGSRPRRMSITKNSSTNSKLPKQSTLTSLNMSRRNSISRPSIKLTNT